MKNLIHWLMKMSDVRALRQFLRVLNPMMNVVSFAIQIGTPRDKSILRTHASFTPVGLPPIGAKHIQNALPNLQLDQTKIFPVCGKKVS